MYFCTPYQYDQLHNIKKEVNAVEGVQSRQTKCLSVCYLTK